MDAKEIVVGGDVLELKDAEARDLLGSETLDTEATTVTGAINELNSNLENKQAKLKSKTVTVTINSGSATGAAGSGVVRSKIISIILCKNDDVYYTPITYSVYDTGSIECRAFTTPTVNRSYTFIVWYVD